MNLVKICLVKGLFILDFKNANSSEIRLCAVSLLIMGSYVDEQIYKKGAREFGSFAFAYGLGHVSRKSKCAKSAVAVY